MTRRLNYVEIDCEKCNHRHGTTVSCALAVKLRAEQAALIELQEFSKAVARRQGYTVPVVSRSLRRIV